MQKGERVFGRYAGGRIDRGTLVGRIRDRTLVFRYAQRESCGEIHAGRSTCEVQSVAGRVRIIEHYAWTTRAGTGVNVFDEA
jgi:hypothetical protein